MDEGCTRIDKWLWHARFARTRTRAQEMVRAGKVRINMEKTRDAARKARPGDILTLALADRIVVCRVVALAERRGSPAQARLLCEAVGSQGGTPGAA
jgi:ribosome-associated heat shock protein Hsp15